MQVDGRDNAHVGLAPLAAAVRDLVLEELEGVEAEFLLGHLERFAQDVGGLVVHQQQVAVRFVLADLLHHAQVVDERKEVAAGEVCDGFLG